MPRVSRFCVVWNESHCKHGYYNQRKSRCIRTCPAINAPSASDLFGVWWYKLQSSVETFDLKLCRAPFVSIMSNKCFKLNNLLFSFSSSTSATTFSLRFRPWVRVQFLIFTICPTSSRSLTQHLWDTLYMLYFLMKTLSNIFRVNLQAFSATTEIYLKFPVIELFSHCNIFSLLTSHLKKQKLFT